MANQLPNRFGRVNQSKSWQNEAAETVFTPFLLRFNYDLCYGAALLGVNCGKSWHLRNNNYECIKSVCLLCEYVQIMQG